MRPIDMAEFVGEEPISVGVDEPITFENKTDTAFDVGCGIVFRKSGLYRVSIVGRHMSVAVEPERKKMSNKEWIDFLSEQFNVSRTTAREMLHSLMMWKAEDNFKKQFSGGK